MVPTRRIGLSAIWERLFGPRDRMMLSDLIKPEYDKWKAEFDRFDNDFTSEVFPRLGSVRLGHTEIPVELAPGSGAYPTTDQILSLVWNRDGFNIPITRSELASPQLLLPPVIRIETPEQWACVRRIIYPSSQLTSFGSSDTNVVLWYSRIDERFYESGPTWPDLVYPSLEYRHLTLRNTNTTAPKSDVLLDKPSDVLPDKPMETGVVRKLKHKRSEKG